MSYIVRTGNLAATPELQEGENGPFCFARVLVNDRLRDEDGNWRDGPVVGYDVAINGAQAKSLVATAAESGNVRVTVAGKYWVDEYNGQYKFKIRADEVAVSLKGQSVHVARKAATGRDE